MSYHSFALPKKKSSPSLTPKAIIAALRDILEPMAALNASLGSKAEPGSRYFDPEKSKQLADHCMPFCGDFILQETRDDEYHFPGYVPCVPRDQKLPIDRNFPEGRFSKHTAKSKDAWVELAVNAWQILREQAETDEEDINEVVDEYGVNDDGGNGGGSTTLRFTKGRINQVNLMHSTQELESRLTRTHTHSSSQSGLELY